MQKEDRYVHYRGYAYYNEFLEWQPCRSTVMYTKPDYASKNKRGKGTSLQTTTTK